MATPMHNAQQALIEKIQSLPTERIAEVEDFVDFLKQRTPSNMYRLYVLDKIRKGQEAVEQGKTITSGELKREIDSW